MNNGNQVINGRLRVNDAGGLRKTGQDFFKARRKNMVIHSSLWLPDGGSASEKKKDSVREGRNSVEMT
jgi:hypothetical protein